jgi:hypothetical protein
VRFKQDVHRRGTMKRRFRTRSKIPFLEQRTREDPHSEHAKTDITKSQFICYALPWIQAMSGGLEHRHFNVGSLKNRTIIT